MHLLLLASGVAGGGLYKADPRPSPRLWSRTPDVPLCAEGLVVKARPDAAAADRAVLAVTGWFIPLGEERRPSISVWR